MSDQPNVPDKLQFDHAEFASPAPVATCRACAQPLRDVYYEVNGIPVCQNCSGQVAQAFTGGSGIGRFIRATLYGSLAGLAGAAVYYGVTAATGMNFGLISVLVGLMVGKAVNKGSHARGGWFYQGLAILLTYIAIVLTFIPPLIQVLAAGRAERAAAAQARPGADLKAEAAAEAAAEAEVIEDAVKPPPTFAEVMEALVYLAGFAIALPIWANLDSPIGLFIVGIGLYEAWVTNRQRPLVINGPYQIAQPDAGDAVHVDPIG